MATTTTEKTATAVPAKAEGSGSFIKNNLREYGLLISLVAGALGFTGVARGAAPISKGLVFIFLVIFVVILILAISANQFVF